MASSERLLVSRDVAVFPPQFLTVMRKLLNLKAPYWYREFEEIYQKVRGMEAIADELLERLGDKAWRPWDAYDELEKQPALAAPYVGHAVPALLRRIYYQANYGVDVARSSDHEDIRLDLSSIFDEPLIHTKMGRDYDIARAAREPDPRPSDESWRANVACALDRAKSFTSSLASLRTPRTSASTEQAYESSFAYDAAMKRML
ncbi:hypothetical protein JCM10049v2_006139 [Rhodotorula toruloides]